MMGCFGRKIPQKYQLSSITYRVDYRCATSYTQNRQRFSSGLSWRWWLSNALLLCCATSLSIIILWWLHVTHTTDDITSGCIWICVIEVEWECWEDKWSTIFSLERKRWGKIQQNQNLLLLHACCHTYFSRCLLHRKHYTYSTAYLSIHLLSRSQSK